MDNKFDDIRPYYDSEIPEAMQRIAKDPLFPILSSYVFPEKTSSEVAEMVRKIKTIREFQLKIMNPANKAICRNSISKLSYSGCENMNAGKAYIYLSNHRDIMLDAALLQTNITTIALIVYIIMQHSKCCKCFCKEISFSRTEFKNFVIFLNV